MMEVTGVNGQLESRNRDPERFILERLRERGVLDTEELGLRVREQVACIEGSVTNLVQKRLIGEIVSQVEGVEQVVNMLRIAPMALVADDILEKRLLRALAGNPELNQAKVSVEVANGFVQLGGLVRTAREKCVAEDEAWAISGVRGVANEFEVLSAMTKSDGQIVEEVLQGLSRCLGINVSKVEVEFLDSVLHLRGSVQSEALRSAAEEVACWTPSVHEVVNNLEVVRSDDASEESGLVESPATPTPQTVEDTYQRTSADLETHVTEERRKRSGSDLLANIPRR